MFISLFVQYSIWGKMIEARQLYDGLDLGDIESCRNLCFVRLYGSDRVIGLVTLDVALRGGGVSIVESGRVDSLRVSSTLDSRVFIAGGMVVEGKSQNRAAQQPAILPPRVRDAELPVRCVEQGQGLVDGSSYGRSRTIVMPSVRSGRVGQRETWVGVAGATRVTGAGTPTLDYAAVLDHDKEIGDYVSALGEPKKGQVGYVVAIKNGRSDGATAMYADFFGSRELFSGLSKMLHQGVAVAARQVRHDDVSLVVPRDGFVAFIEQARSVPLVEVPSRRGLDGQLYLMERPIAGSALVYEGAPVQVSLRRDLN